MRSSYDRPKTMNWACTLSRYVPTILVLSAVALVTSPSTRLTPSPPIVKHLASLCSRSLLYKCCVSDSFLSESSWTHVCSVIGCATLLWNYRSCCFVQCRQRATWRACLNCQARAILFLRLYVAQRAKTHYIMQATCMMIEIFNQDWRLNNENMLNELYCVWWIVLFEIKYKIF